MKKLIVSVLALTMVLTSSIGAFASEGEKTETVYNMDAETYEETRMDQINEALANGDITLEQAELLRAHVLDVVAEGSFGNGPKKGNKGDGNVECVLGEELKLGIFRSESAGMKTGNGNGIGQKLADGTGRGSGKQVGGKGNGAAKGQGVGQDNHGVNRSDSCDGECTLD